jgi:hypothetical protein
MTGPRPAHRRSTSALVTVLLATLAAVPAAFALAAPAHAGGAAEISRYWIYFHVRDGEYAASQEGLATAVPEDGALEALRYAAPADSEDPVLPRADLDVVTFDAVCGSEAPAEGQKRVAMVIDYGVEADAEGAEVPAPVAECAVVPEDATALQAVQAVAEVRTESSSFGPTLCAVDDYPASGCSEVVSEATPEEDGTVEFAIAGLEGGDDSAGGPGDDSAPVGADEAASEDSDGESDYGTLIWIGAIAVVAVILLLGGAEMRRRRARA